MKKTTLKVTLEVLVHSDEIADVCDRVREAEVTISSKTLDEVADIQTVEIADVEVTESR